MSEALYITKAENAIARVADTIQAEYTRIANEFREEIVIPFCEKYNLNYGYRDRIIFVDPKTDYRADKVDAEIWVEGDLTEYGEPDDDDFYNDCEQFVLSRGGDEFAKELLAVFELLHLKADRSMRLGDYMAAYTCRFSSGNING